MSKLVFCGQHSPFSKEIEASLSLLGQGGSLLNFRVLPVLAKTASGVIAASVCRGRDGHLLDGLSRRSL